MRWALGVVLGLSTVSLAAPVTVDATVRDLQARGVLQTPARWDVASARSIPWGRASFVRLEQQVSGVPVEGGPLVLALDPSGQVRHVRGTIAPEVNVSVAPTIGSNAAKAKVDKVRRWMGQGELWPDRSALRLWFDGQGRAHLVWAIDLSTSSPVATWRVLVDAHSGDVLRGARTSREARGRVYPQNPEVSELEVVELPRLTSGDTLRGMYCRVQTCERGVAELPVGPTRCYEASARATPDEAGDYLYDPDPGALDDPFAEVNVYYQVDRVADWYERELSYRRAEVIDVYTKFPMENALFGDVNGDGVGDIALGYSERTDYSYDGDVLAHEFGHGLLNILWDHPIFEADEYGILVNSMAMDEGFADVFAMSMFGDAQVGEYAGRDGAPIRDLEPDHRCPDDLFGESHYDGMIWASMAWNMMDDPAVGNRATVALVVGTAAGLPNGGDFDEAATVMLETAGDLRDDGVIDDAGLRAIERHLEASGVQGCERVIALDDGAQPRTLAMWSGLLGLLGREHMATVAQYSLTVPKRADQLVFSVTEWRRLGGASHDFTVFVRRGAPIGHELNPAPLVGDLSDPVDYDWRVDGDAAGFDVVVLDSKEQPLVEGETWYFAVASRGDGEGQLWDQAVARFEGRAIEKEQGLACGCSGLGAAGGWWLLPLLFVVMSTRRRAHNGELL